jgi:hypothetical protein
MAYPRTAGLAYTAEIVSSVRRFFARTGSHHELCHCRAYDILWPERHNPAGTPNTNRSTISVIKLSCITDGSAGHDNCTKPLCMER